MRYVVGQMKGVISQDCGQAAAHPTPIAAVECAQFGCMEYVSGIGETRLMAIDLYRAAQAVPPFTDWCDACPDAYRCDFRWINVREGGVHVVGTSSYQIHAIDPDADSVVSQPMQSR
ncbi:MAG: hypothetical protein Fur0040_10270 [Sideroxydans sp.]